MRLGYRPALDGLRAVAILAVLGFHAGGFLPAGDLGVDLFFVLSGFLITTLLLEEYAERGSVSLRAFYVRRALRLLPALFAMLAVFLVVAIVVALVHEAGALQEDVFGVVAGLGYFSNIAMAGEPGVRLMPDELRHLWSLAAEEQFYLLWPALLFLVLGARARLACIFLVTAIAAATLWQLSLYADGASSARLGVAPDVRMTPILVGCLLAFGLAGSYRLPLSVRTARLLGPVALAALLVFFAVPWGLRIFTGPALAFALCSALVIGLALERRSPLARVLSVAPAVFVGRISYALYLWHFPIFVLLALNDTSAEHPLPTTVLAFGATFGAAVASYYVVERPFLRLKRRVGQPASPERELRPVRPAASV